MKSLEELGQLDRGLRAGEFASYVRHLMLANGMVDQARAMATASHAPQRVVEALSGKAAVSGTEGPSLGPRLLVTGFLDSLRNESVFFALLNGGMVKLPFRTMVGSIATAFGAGIVQPGFAIAVTKASLTQGPELDPRKAAAIVALSQDLLRAAPMGEALLSRSLRAEVVKAVDAEALVVLKAGAATSAATASPEADLETMRAAVAPGSASRLYWISSPAVAALISGLTATGAYRYLTVNWAGGTLKGVPLLVTDRAAAGELLLVDASGIVGNADDVEVNASDQAMLQMDTAPTQSIGLGGSPVATTGVSMFQTNTRAVRCILYFGIEKIRSTAVRILTGIAWAST